MKIAHWLIITTGWLSATSCTILRDQPLFVEERRPSSVPKDAVFVQGAMGGWWEHCDAGAKDEAGENHCVIYNWKGELLYDEPFLPYDGGARASAEELTIPSESPNSGPDRIALKNGRVLIPKSDYLRIKAFLDNVNAKRQ